MRSHHATSLYGKIRSPPYSCDVTLDPRLEKALRNLFGLITQTNNSFNYFRAIHMFLWVRCFWEWKYWCFCDQACFKFHWSSNIWGRCQRNYRSYWWNWYVFSYYCVLHIVVWLASCWYCRKRMRTRAYYGMRFFNQHCSVFFSYTESWNFRI